MQLMFNTDDIGRKSNIKREESESESKLVLCLLCFS